MHSPILLFLLLLALRAAPEPVELKAPDAAFGARLQWAQARLATELECASRAECDDVAINTLALSSLGRFDLVRPALVRATYRSPLWVLGAYQYWTASADHAFVREQWNFITGTLASGSAHAQHDGGVFLAAVHGVLDMAAARSDSTALRRAEEWVPSAEQRAQAEPGIFAPALALVDADRAEAHLDFLVDSAHARWPLGTGLIALGLYRYHRERDGFALLQRMAREETSTAAMFVLPLLRGLIGWEVDAPRRAIALEPHLPGNWKWLSVQNLRAGREVIDLEITRDAGVYHLQLSKESATPLAIRVAPALPRGARINSVLVNDADLPVHAESNQHDTHVVIETTLRREINIEIDYVAPRRSASRL